MKIGVVVESFPGERRVAVIPAAVPSLTKADLDMCMESNAGLPSGFRDAAYTDKDVEIVSRRNVFETADVVLQVRAPGANAANGQADADMLRKGQVLIGLCEPLVSHDATRTLAARGVTTFAMELMPRITRAQSMDSLSSMATVAGYKAVLLASTTLPRMFPMFMTAAGTVTPAKVLILGAGVAGLQAISTARRLGAVVHAYDVRPAVKEQVESLGAKFVELPLETEDSEGKDGYAKAQDESFYKRQRELMGKIVAESDVVITTAAIPGKTSPVLVTADMVEGMAPGSVIVDLAAERGGNCELTRADETVIAHDVTILGPTNLPSTAPYHASQMYSKNITTFLLHLVKEGQMQFDLNDEITKETLLTRDGLIVHERVRDLAGSGEPRPSEGRNS